MVSSDRKARSIPDVEGARPRAMASRRAAGLSWGLSVRRSRFRAPGAERYGVVKQRTDLFIDFFGEVNLVEVLRSLDARLTVTCPVNHEADSVEQLRILSDALHDRCAWVVVKNEAHSDTFKIYDGSKTRRHLVEELQAREITMPRLYYWLVTALNEHNTPVTVALTHPGFNLLDRQRLKNWQTRLYRQLYRAADLLLTDPHSAERFAA